MKKLLKLFRYTFLVSVTFLLIINLNTYAVNANPKISIVTDKKPGVVALHGLTKLTDVLKTKNIAFENVQSIDAAHGELIIVTGLANGDGVASQMLKAGKKDVPRVSEALIIWKTTLQKKSVWVISGFDEKGLMYGLLDVADRIGWTTGGNSPMSEVKEITEQPSVVERGVSLYTMNRAYWESRFYNEEYWTRYLDMLAKDRFNSLIIIFGYENGGFMAPCYPYFFDVEGFSEVRMVGLTREQQERNLSAFNHLIKMAHDRGIKVTAGIKDHIYKGGVQAGGIAGLENPSDKPVPGLVWGVTNNNLYQYTEAALTKFVKVVSNLDGILFFINNETGLRNEQLLEFATDFFRMLKDTAPNMSLYIHSKGLTDPIIKSAVDVGVNFKISPKYWMEQMGMPYHSSHINKQDQFNRRHSYSDMLTYPQKYKMYWRLWNGGTTRILLWGDPEYVSRFAESTHLYEGTGFDVNEPLATKMEAQPHDAKPFDLLKPPYRYYDYEFERYWHFFQVFGRVSYNPETSSDIWDKEFELRFGKEAGPVIETALHEASWILPRIVSSCYPYSCFPTTRGWSEKQRLGDLPEYAKAEGSDIQQFANFDEEAKLLIEGGETARILPSMTSVWLDQTSADINNYISEAEKYIGINKNKEFNSTITDLKILSNLALFHSRRIPAAVSYRLFERTKDASALDQAISHERNAIEAWKKIVEAAGDVYADNLMMGVSEAAFEGISHHLSGHWKDELAYLETGLTALEKQRNDFKGENSAKKAPQYKIASNADNDKLFQVSLLPVLNAPVDKPLTVKVKVTASAGVKWVRLSYRSVNQTEDYKSLEMHQAGENNLFEATVPVEDVNKKWDFMYLIEVMDKNGNGKIYPDFNKETPYVIVSLDR